MTNREALDAYLNSSEREEDARVFWDTAQRTGASSPDLLETLKTMEGVYTDTDNVAAFVHGVACGLALHALWAPEVVEKALALCYPTAATQRVRRECWAMNRRVMARIAGTDIGQIPDNAVQSDEAFNQALVDAMRGYGVEIVTTDAEAADRADAAFEKQLEAENTTALDRATLDDNVSIAALVELCDRWQGVVEPDPDPGGWDRWVADLARSS